MTLSSEEKQELANRIYRLVNEINLAIEDAHKVNLTALIQVSNPFDPPARVLAIIYEQSMFENTNTRKSFPPPPEVAPPKTENQNPGAAHEN